MRPTSRRGFLKRSLSVTAGTLLIAGTKASGDFRGANETVRVAVAGINGRGTAHIEEFCKLKGVRVTHLVDPDVRLFPGKVKMVEDKGKNTPKVQQDVRKVLEDKDVDVVSIATPNHWHALMTIWACQAGKDVYVEKPCSHNVHEGRIAVETARLNNRIVQHGTQNRSGGDWAKVAAAIASGKLGKLLVSRALCYKKRDSIGFREPEPPPAEVDFDLWLGPAPQQAFHRNLVHYNWHWFWDTGNGDIGNQGVHEMDKARWAIPGATAPKSVISLGGRFGYRDQGQTPNTQVAICDYGQTQLIFEVRGLKTGKHLGQDVGNVFHLEAGTIRGTKFYPTDKDEPEPLPDAPVAKRPGGGNFANFIAACRSRQVADLNADILEAHWSCVPIHLANASYRLGQEVAYDAKAKAFGDDKAAGETLERMADHLASNDVAIDGLKYRLGKVLTFDAATEKTGDAEADAILRGTYRKGFEVPEKVR